MPEHTNIPTFTFRLLCTPEDETVNVETCPDNDEFKLINIAL
jgi:hypothetical protein